MNKLIGAAKHVLRNWGKYSAAVAALVIMGYPVRQDIIDGFFYTERPNVRITTDYPKAEDIWVEAVGNTEYKPAYVGLYLGGKFWKGAYMRDFEDKSNHGAYYIEHDGAVDTYHRRVGRTEWQWNEIRPQSALFMDVYRPYSCATIEVVVADGHGNAATREVRFWKKIWNNIKNEYKVGRSNRPRCMIGTYQRAK